MSSANAHSDGAANDFSRFDFDPSLAKGLSQAGFETPRPIQAETIPACLEGRDVMGLAQTGTGKTAAFALPIMQRLLEEPGRGPLVLILARPGSSRSRSQPRSNYSRNSSTSGRPC